MCSLVSALPTRQLQPITTLGLADACPCLAHALCSAAGIPQLLAIPASARALQTRLALTYDAAAFVPKDGALTICTDPYFEYNNGSIWCMRPPLPQRITLAVASTFEHFLALAKALTLDAWHPRYNYNAFYGRAPFEYWGTGPFRSSPALEQPVECVRGVMAVETCKLHESSVLPLHLVLH